ncbi:MoaD/ThiS family protein [Solimonas soli]|uniref:MoaD/ThiS family protein n=1 Tax=Solimonas soli TaxID=413479 RepID=UPI0004BA3ABE|nr:MoaD/ThiS family protein [Solimonas soli]
MSTITFEFHGQLLRLAGVSEWALPLAVPATLADVLDQLAAARPELAAALVRCACAIGDRLVLRREPLHGGERIALLPPVAGG